MADTYIINASNQTVTGTASGGKDTIKAGTPSATRQTIDAVVTGLNPSIWLDFGETYGGNFFYFSTHPDGIHITNENGSYKFKFWGVTNTSICTGDTKNIFRALQQTTPWDDHWLGGTELADTLTVNHARCKATGRGGDDVITSSGNFNLLEGSAGNDIVINNGNNGTLRGDNGDDILICGGSNSTLTGGNSNVNKIYAGRDGNILWGGEDTVTDYLFGGAGTDVFQIGKYNGSDTVFGSDYGDVVHLYDVNLSDIVSAGIDANTIALGLNSGNVISVANGDAISPTFVLADGSAYRFNRVANSWQTA